MAGSSGTKLYRLGEQLQKLYGQKVVNSKITRQEALLVAAQATNRVLQQLIWQNKAMGIDTMPYGVFREYRLGVAKDTLRGKWYAQLPVRTLESLHNNMGIYHVAPADDIDDLMVPLDAGFNSMFKGLEAFQLEGKLGYIPERDRIYIQGAEFEADFELYVRLIPDSTSLEPDDLLPLPAALEFDALQIGLQLLGVQINTPQDVQNDNL